MVKRCTTGKVYLNIKEDKCYKCKDIMKVAWCTTMYDNGNHGAFYGPEAFDDETIKIAKENDVILKKVFSKTMQESCFSNACPSCGAFIGQFFIHDYLYSEDKKIELGTFDTDKETNKTLDYYNKNALKYIQDTTTVEFEDKQNILLKYLKPGAHILDLGCGSGRDSKAFIQKGYKVTAMDGASEICEIASKYIGQKVICKKFQDLNKRSVFDAVWACSSILHIPSNDLHNVINNIFKALKSGGYFYTSFKYGDFEGERNGRYFTYLTEKSFKFLLEPFNQLEIIEITITADVRKGREHEKWLNAIIKKN